MERLVNFNPKNGTKTVMICSFACGSENDSRFHSETLYYSQTGVFFVEICNGEDSPYNIVDASGGKAWGGNCRILTDAEAVDFVREHGDLEEFERNFGYCRKLSDVQIIVTIPEEAKKKLLYLAGCRPVGELASEILINAL